MFKFILLIVTIEFIKNLNIKKKKTYNSIFLGKPSKKKVIKEGFNFIVQIEWNFDSNTMNI